MHSTILQSTDLLACALAWHRLGCSPLALQPTRDGRLTHRHLMLGGSLQPVTSESELPRLWDTHPDHTALGLIGGTPTLPSRQKLPPRRLQGLAILTIHIATGGKAGLAALLTRVGPVPETSGVRTPEGNFHLLYRYDGGNFPAVPLAPGVTIAADPRRFLAVPPSPGWTWFRDYDGRDDYGDDLPCNALSPDLLAHMDQVAEALIAQALIAQAAQLPERLPTRPHRGYGLPEPLDTMLSWGRLDATFATPGDALTAVLVACATTGLDLHTQAAALLQNDLRLLQAVFGPDCPGLTPNRQRGDPLTDEDLVTRGWVLQLLTDFVRTGTLQGLPSPAPTTVVVLEAPAPDPALEPEPEPARASDHEGKREPAPEPEPEPAAAVRPATPSRVERERLRQGIVAFVDTYCSRRPEVCIPSGALYHAYRQWCTTTERPWATETLFGTTLNNLGIARHRVTGGIVRQGITLRDRTMPEQITTATPTRRSPPSTRPRPPAFLTPPETLIIPVAFADKLTALQMTPEQAYLVHHIHHCQESPMFTKSTLIDQFFPYIPIPRDLLRRKLRTLTAADRTRLLDDGILERTNLYDRQGKQCYGYRVGPVLRDLWFASASELSLEARLRQGHVHALTGEPVTRPQETLYRNADGVLEPPLIRQAFPHITSSRLDLGALQAAFDALKAHADACTDGVLRQSLRYRYLSAMHCFDGIVRQLPTYDPATTILTYTPAYTGSTSGRMFERLGAAQSLPRVFKATGYQGLGVTNYDLRSSQVAGLWELLRPYGLPAALQQTLEAYLQDRQAKADYAQRAGMPDTDLWKRSLLSLFFGATTEMIIRRHGKTTRSPERAQQLRDYQMFTGDVQVEPGSLFEGMLQWCARYDPSLDAAELFTRFLDVAAPFIAIRDAWFEVIRTRIIPEQTKVLNGVRVLVNAVEKPLILPRRIGMQAIRTVSAHLLQGKEACVIFHLIRQAPDFGYQVCSNEHDGLITAGLIPREALQQARDYAELPSVELEEKAFTGETPSP